MQDEPVVGNGALLHGNVSFQVLLHGKGGASVREAQAVRHAEHVRVYGNHRLVVHDGGNYVGGFSAHARKAHERVNIGRNFPVIIGHEHPGHGNQVPGFGVGVGDALYVGVNVVKTGR